MAKVFAKYKMLVATWPFGRGICASAGYWTALGPLAAQVPPRGHVAATRLHF